MKIINRKKFIRSILILIVITIFLILGCKSIFHKEERKTVETQYIVSSGDTLWKIALKNKYEDQDPRDYIYKIEKINNLDSAMIYEGQELTIITYEEAIND